MSRLAVSDRGPSDTIPMRVAGCAIGEQPCVAATRILRIFERVVVSEFEVLKVGSPVHDLMRGVRAQVRGGWRA